MSKTPLAYRKIILGKNIEIHNKSNGTCLWLD